MTTRAAIKEEASSNINTTREVVFTDSVIESLIRAIKERPALWDFHHNDYKIKKIKQSVWLTVAPELGFNGSSLPLIKSKWKLLSAAFMKALKSDKKEKDFKFFDSLSFLKNRSPSKRFANRMVMKPLSVIRSRNRSKIYRDQQLHLRDKMRSAIQFRSCLWDRNHIDYCNREVREKVWKEAYMEIGMKNLSLNYIKRKWDGIRRKCIKEWTTSNDYENPATDVENDVDDDGDSDDDQTMISMESVAGDDNALDPSILDRHELIEVIDDTAPMSTIMASIKEEPVELPAVKESVNRDKSPPMVEQADSSRANASASGQCSSIAEKSFAQNTGEMVTLEMENLGWIQQRQLRSILIKAIDDFIIALH